jgi:CBS domain-containing protein
MSKHVGDVMTPLPWTVPASCSLPDAARLMRSWDVREVFVSDHGRLCGVLTDEHIIVVAIASGRPPSQLTAGDCHNPNTPRVGVDQDVPEVLTYMRRNHLQRVPVVDGDRLVGAAWINDLEVAVPQKAD